MRITDFHRPTSIVLRASALAAVAALALAGCATPSPGAAETTSAASTAGAITDAAAPVTVVDPWIKATDTAMTGAFVTIINTGDAPIVLVGATAAIAGATELHETVDDGTGTPIMQERPGGFTIPAGGELVLEPGGDHLMLMSLSGPIVAGDELEITLEFEGGATATFTAVAKDFAGANENYGGEGHGVENGDANGDAPDTKGGRA